MTEGSFAEAQEAHEVCDLIMRALRQRNPSIGGTVVAITSILAHIVCEFTQGNLELADEGIDSLMQDMKLNLRLMKHMDNVPDDVPTTLQ